MPRVTIAADRIPIGELQEEIFYTYQPGDRKRHRIPIGELKDRKRSLVYIHGAGGNHLYWPHQLRRMEGVDVYALDLPGHGRSQGKGRSSMAAYREFVFAFLEALGLKQVTLVGHSMGGAIVLDCALRHPASLEGMILIGAGARLRVAPAILESMRQDFEAAVRLICDYAYASAAAAQLVRLGRRQMLRTDPQVFYGDFAVCDAFDVTDRLGEIRCPTLIICGTEDRLTPPKYSTFLRDHIAGAQLLLVEEAGHMVMLEQPEVVRRAVAQFMAL